MSGFGAPSGKGAGGELSLAEELWILENVGKNVIDSKVAGAERRIKNIVEDDGDIKVISVDV